VPRAELAYGRVGDDGDVMAARLVRLALRLLAGRAACIAASCCILHDVEIRSSTCVSGSASESTHQSGLDLSCEAETCRARRRLSSSGKLVGDALASVGLD
jgi:hypothetical protein